ncbi:uncharacterized protein LOC133552824 isoform X2 [Nerophis ophidion]|uniref:uncharacterized protein LOC133552824 isoform X2 n=1 Tax=Nerophis ophidion TaxID=159077 RepID=UPI002ADF9616|nr:uncharacterized protein LOC133552824 isoform X2 [Nerophis ophidion]
MNSSQATTASAGRSSSGSSMSSSLSHGQESARSSRKISISSSSERNTCSGWGWRSAKWPLLARLILSCFAAHLLRGVATSWMHTRPVSRIADMSGELESFPCTCLASSHRPPPDRRMLPPWRKHRLPSPRRETWLPSETLAVTTPVATPLRLSGCTGDLQYVVCYSSINMRPPDRHRQRRVQSGMALSLFEFFCHGAESNPRFLCGWICGRLL